MESKLVVYRYSQGLLFDRLGEILAKSGRSSIPPKPVLKIIAKREPKKEEAKSERAKEEVVDSAFTRVRMDTPTNDRSEGPPNPVAETAITYSNHVSDGETEEEQEADYGDSDGGDMRRLARPKHPSVIYMRRARVALPTGKV